MQDPLSDEHLSFLNEAFAFSEQLEGGGLVLLVGSRGAGYTYSWSDFGPPAAWAPLGPRTRALLAIGAGLGRGRSLTLAIVSALLALLLGLYTQWGLSSFPELSIDGSDLSPGYPFQRHLACSWVLSLDSGCPTTRNNQPAASEFTVRQHQCNGG